MDLKRIEMTTRRGKLDANPFLLVKKKREKLDRGVDRVKPWFMVHGLAHGS